MVIRRIEITLNDSELDLINYLDSQKMRTATFIKHCIRQQMDNYNSTVDYEKIRQIVNDALSHQYKIPVQQAKQPSNNQSKLLQSFSKKY